MALTAGETRGPHARGCSSCGRSSGVDRGVPGPEPGAASRPNARSVIYRRRLAVVGPSSRGGGGWGRRIAIRGHTGGRRCASWRWTCASGGDRGGDTAAASWRIPPGGSATWAHRRGSGQLSLLRHPHSARTTLCVHLAAMQKAGPVALPSSAGVAAALSAPRFSSPTWRAVRSRGCLLPRPCELDAARAAPAVRIVCRAAPGSMLAVFTEI